MPPLVAPGSHSRIEPRIPVDTGIRAAQVVARANELGIDTIVTDHHLPDSELPPAVAVLNPNQRGCGYPNKNLCGAGVAFKLAWGIGLAMSGATKCSESFRDFLVDATALAAPKMNSPAMTAPRRKMRFTLSPESNDERSCPCGAVACGTGGGFE